MTIPEMLLTIAIAGLVTVSLRALPFVLFRNGGKVPAFIHWMGEQLPRAVMAMLLVYCLKDVDIASHPWGLPAFIGVAVTAALHVWKKQMILSICGGTMVYMLLIRVMA